VDINLPTPPTHFAKPNKYIEIIANMRVNEKLENIEKSENQTPS